MSAPSEAAEDEYSDTELTPNERKRVRKMLEADKRARWFWVTVRTWVMWVGGGAVAITAGYQWIKDAVKVLAR